MDSKVEIEKIYKDTLYKLVELKKKRKNIVNGYIGDLEQKKIKSIIDSLNSK